MARAGPPLPVGGDSSPTDPARRRPRTLVVAVPVAVLLVLLPAVAWRWWDARPPALTAADVDRAAAAAVREAREQDAAAPPEGVTVYRTILPSLVTVTTESASGAEAGLGAGTVVRDDGTVLTALHVVDGGTRITVRFADGTEADATVASRQEDQDLALLTVDTLPQVVVPAVLGGGVRVGDPVYPVGDPLGLQGSLTAGVVSATDRTVRVDDGLTLRDLVQFDAAVNPGSSGGPLLNAAGQVVGVVTALANPTRRPYFVGIGFAVPLGSAGGGAGGPSI